MTAIGMFTRKRTNAEAVRWTGDADTPIVRAFLGNHGRVVPNSKPRQLWVEIFHRFPVIILLEGEWLVRECGEYREVAQHVFGRIYEAR